MAEHMQHVPEQDEHMSARGKPAVFKEESERRNVIFFPRYPSCILTYPSLNTPSMKSFSTSDVASHNKPTDLYIIVDKDVYDLTKFQDEHPGGKKIIQRVAGKDASKQFWKYHNEGILKKYKSKLQVGSIGSEQKSAAVAEKKSTPAAPPAQKPTASAFSSQVQQTMSTDAVKPTSEPGQAVVPAPGPGAQEAVKA
ncbi:hypothetical protein LTR66_015032, partial [Elasticomyces elasticus]